MQMSYAKYDWHQVMNQNQDTSEDVNVDQLNKFDNKTEQC